MTIANPTNIYQEPSTDSKILESYKLGIVLGLEEYNSEFFKIHF